MIEKVFTRKSIFELSPAEKLIIYSLLLLWTFVVLFPLYWLFITGFKLPIDVSRGPFYLPFVDFQPSLHAWEYALVDIRSETVRPFINTIITGLASTTIAIFLGSAAAYALARFRYQPRVGAILTFIACLAVVVVAILLGVPWLAAVLAGMALFIIVLQTIGKRFKRALGNGDIAFWLISQRMLPPVAVVIPIYILFQQLRLLDTRTSLIITYVIIDLPIVIWLMRDFFLSLPVSLEESAAIDGASRFQIFYLIVLPLSVPGLVATFLLILVFAWNEYLLALFLSSANAQTMPLMVAAQNTIRGPQWWTMSVMITIMIIPVIIMAIVLERFIARGLLIGAVKG